MTADVTGGRPLVEWLALTIVLDGLPIVLRVVEGYQPPTWPAADVPLQMHFELVVHDPDEAATRLAQRGATYATHQDADDPHYVVMLDPAGHPFCLIRSSMARRP